MDRVEVCEVQVCNTDYNSALHAIEEFMNTGKHGFSVFLEANLLFSLQTIPVLSEVIRKSEFIFPDGTAVTKAAGLRHRIRMERLPGPTFILKACDYGQKRQWRHFFYGGMDGVAEKLVMKLKNDFPEMIVAGIYSPPFRKIKGDALDIPPEEDEIEINMINESNPDFVWVGLGGPKQEYWMYSHLNKINAPMLMGVGAAFDFHSGARPWAPKWIRTLGMEWLYRMFSGGKATFTRNLRCVSCSMLLLFDYFIKYRIFHKKN